MAFECSPQLPALVHSMPSVKTVAKASLPVVGSPNETEEITAYLGKHEPDGLYDELAVTVPQHASRPTRALGEIEYSDGALLHRCVLAFQRLDKNQERKFTLSKLAVPDTCLISSRGL